MIANVTIAHLSACRFVYEGKKLRQCREKIRLTMSVLKRLSEHWTLGKRTYQEIGVISREVLRLTTDNIRAPEPMMISEVEEPQLDLGSLSMLPGQDFDLCAVFDSSVLELLKTLYSQFCNHRYDEYIGSNKFTYFRVRYSCDLSSFRAPCCPRLTILLINLDESAHPITL